MKNNKPLDSTSRADARTLTLSEAKSLLHAAWFQHPPCAAYFILRTWAGLRDSEVRELDPSDLESGTVIVGSSTRRNVQLAVNVIMMLSVLRQEGRLTREALNPSPRVVTAVIKKAGFQTMKEKETSSDNKPVWVPNMARHTALSYHFAYHRDSLLTCLWAGHRPAHVNHHYKSLLSHEERNFQKLWTAGGGKKAS